MTLQPMPALITYMSLSFRYIESKTYAYAVADYFPSLQDQLLPKKDLRNTGTLFASWSRVWIL